jgi:hypothetical protein
MPDTIYIVTVRHEDSYNVDPEEPEAFRTEQAAEAYLQTRGFNKVRTILGETSWEHTDAEEFLTFGNIKPTPLQ